MTAVKNNQAAFVEKPASKLSSPTGANAVELFKSVSVSIGSNVYQLSSKDEIAAVIANEFPEIKTVISCDSCFSSSQNHGQAYDTIDMFIIEAKLGIAENGAVWLTSKEIPNRALPFMVKHFVVIISRCAIVHTMYDAYEVIGSDDYGFAVFVAGPSKTADIEQTLVLGAHGPETMSVFLVE